MWNLVSGHVFCRLQVPCNDSQYKCKYRLLCYSLVKILERVNVTGTYDSINLIGLAGEQNAISKIAFLAARINDKLSAMLISNGPNGKYFLSSQ